MTERHQVTYRSLRLRKLGAGARLRERQHELKSVFRFRVRIGFGVVFRSAPTSLFVELLVFGRPRVVDVVDSKRLVNHADTRVDSLVEKVELVRNVVVAFRALPRPPAEIRGHLGDLQLPRPEPRDPSARRCDGALEGPHVDGDSKATLMAAHCRLDAHCAARLVGLRRWWPRTAAWMRTAACAARLVGESSWQKRLARPRTPAVPHL